MGTSRYSTAGPRTLINKEDEIRGSPRTKERAYGVTSRWAIASRVASGSAASCGATDASLLVMRRSANVDAESRNSTEEPRGPSFFPPALAPFAFGRVDIEDEVLKSPDRTNPKRVALGAHEITAIGQSPVPHGQRERG